MYGFRYIVGADGTGAYITDGDDSYVKTDDESYMRTDEEDAELYDRDPKVWTSLKGQEIVSYPLCRPIYL